MTTVREFNTILTEFGDEETDVIIIAPDRNGEPIYLALDDDGYEVAYRPSGKRIIILNAYGLPDGPRGEGSDNDGDE